MPQAGGGTNHCHILSQAQHIDWQTTEVKPVIEWNLGPVVVEYSRPMRVFNQFDQLDYRFYDFSGASGYQPYSIVPNNTTQLDQLKLSAQVNEDNRFYGFLYTGNTRSEGLAVLPQQQPRGDEVNNRRMSGIDVRLTNTAINNLTLTPYARYVTESNLFSEPADTTFPINYERMQGGLRTLWRPFGGGFGLGGLAISGNYEWGDLHRSTCCSRADGINAVAADGGRHAITNTFAIGPTVRWSPQFDTYLHFKYYDTDEPLFAVAHHYAQQPRLIQVQRRLDEHLVAGAGRHRRARRHVDAQRPFHAQ